MKRKLLVILLTLIMATGMIAFPTAAETTLPATVGAPEHFAAAIYRGDYFNYTASAPDDLRALLESGASIPTIQLQIDYKLDKGDWHYTSSWDTDYKKFYQYWLHYQ